MRARMWRAEDGEVYPVGEKVTDALDDVFGIDWPGFAATRLIIYMLQHASERMRPVERFRRARLEAYLMGCHGLDIKRAREHVIRLDNVPPYRLHEEIGRHLQACDAIINMNNAIAELRGRTLEEIGFTTIDQVHGNASRKHCGCVLAYLFDHHLAGQPDRIGVYWHYPHAVCAKHAHLLPDWRAHFAAVSAESEALARTRIRRAGLRLIQGLGMRRGVNRVLHGLGLKTPIKRAA